MKSTWLTGIGATILLAIVLVIWKLGSSALSAPPASQTAVTVALVALIGTLFTAAITLLGLLLKDSVDRRSAMLQVEAEKRLRMDTALKAVDLMTKAEAAGAPGQEGREAALLVISSLAQPRLALTLGNQYWRQGKISTDAFISIVDQCFTSGNAHVIIDAAVALEMNAAALSRSPDEIALPPTICFEWRQDLPTAARFALLRTLARAVLAKPYSYWHPRSISAVTHMMSWALADRDANLRNAAAHFILQLCEHMQWASDAEVVAHDVGSVKYSEIHAAAMAVIAEPGGTMVTTAEAELIEQMQTWRTPEETTPPAAP